MIDFEFLDSDVTDKEHFDFMQKQIDMSATIQALIESNAALEMEVTIFAC